MWCSSPPSSASVADLTRDLNYLLIYLFKIFISRPKSFYPTFASTCTQWAPKAAIGGRCKLPANRLLHGRSQISYRKQAHIGS